MLLKMAFRNIFRHKIRTALTVFMIFFGLFIGIIGVAINNGMSKQAVESFIRTDIGTMMIFDKEYYQNREDNNPMDFELENEYKILEVIENHSEISAYSPRIKFRGSFTNGRYEIPVTFLGIKPLLEDDVFKRSNSIISGEYIRENDNNQILIGKNNARILELEVGDYITIIARDAKKGMNALDVEIKGIFETGNLKIDNNVIFTSKKLARDFTQKEFINEIVLMTSSFEEKNIEKIISDLSSILNDNIRIIPWYEEIADFLAMMEVDAKGNYIFTFLILLMAGFGIANTLIMSVFERKKEIGILYAMGLSRKKMLGLFTIEGTMVGVIAAILACAAGAVLTTYMYNHGIYIPVGSEYAGEAIPIGNRIYGYITPVKIILFGLIGVVIAALSSLYPSYFATKMNPVEIMRD
ncbi:MAG: ABC transporter permease [Candidatus Muiribacteriota bacterium]